MANSTSEEKSKKKPFNYIVKFWLIVAGLFLLTLLFFYGVAQGWFGTMPSFEELENPKSNLASEVISSDGVVLGTYFIENRSNVDYHHISPNLINAAIAIEDIRYREHSGCLWFVVRQKPRRRKYHYPATC